MPSNITVQLTLTGHFPDNHFINWIVQRALVLDLTGSVRQSSTSEIHIVATGHRVLIEALETACSLGPIEITVDSIASRVIDSAADVSGFVAE